MLQQIALLIGIIGSIASIFAVFQTIRDHSDRRKAKRDLIMFISFASVAVVSFVVASLLGEETTPNGPNSEIELQPIAVALKISHSYPEECLLKPEIEYYLVRSRSPLSQRVVEPGAARILVPEGVTTVNEQIPLPIHKQLEFECKLPKSKALHDALRSGGFELQLIIETDYGEIRKTQAQRVFDHQSVQRGFDFHVYPAYKEKAVPPKTTRPQDIDTGQ